MILYIKHFLPSSTGNIKGEKMYYPKKWILYQDRASNAGAKVYVKNHESSHDDYLK
jgi:hypothetical protein